MSALLVFIGFICWMADVNPFVIFLVMMLAYICKPRTN